MVQDLLDIGLRLNTVTIALIMSLVVKPTQIVAWYIRAFLEVSEEAIGIRMFMH